MLGLSSASSKSKRSFSAAFITIGTLPVFFESIFFLTRAFMLSTFFLIMLFVYTNPIELSASTIESRATFFFFLTAGVWDFKSSGRPCFCNIFTKTRSESLSPPSFTSSRYSISASSNRRNSWGKKHFYRVHKKKEKTTTKLTLVLIFTRIHLVLVRFKKIQG